MGGRGYHNDVKGYLSSNKRTSDFGKLEDISTKSIDFIYDKVSPNAPWSPEFSNSPNKTYVLLNKGRNGIKSIIVFDKNHEAKYYIHLDHPHNGKSGAHVHSGFNTGRKDMPLTKHHKDLIKKVNRIFNGRSR